MNRSTFSPAPNILAPVALLLPLLSPTAHAGAPAASTARPDPVVVTNPVTIANPVSSVTISNTVPVTVTNPVSTVTVGNTVPVTGTVNIGTMPGLKIDTTTPLPVKSAKVYSATVYMPVTNAASSGGWADAFISLPAPAVLETIAANCGGSASRFFIGGTLVSEGADLTVSESYGNAVVVQNQISSGVPIGFPATVGGGVLPLMATPINIAFQSSIALFVNGDLVNPSSSGAYACYFHLTLRELN